MHIKKDSLSKKKKHLKTEKIFQYLDISNDFDTK